MKQRKGWRMSRAHSYSRSRAHSPNFPSSHLHHNSFSNSSVALPTYVTAHSPTHPLLHLRHSSFSNPFFASPTSQVHLIHLASLPCDNYWLSFLELTGVISFVCYVSTTSTCCVLCCKSFSFIYRI